MIIYRVFKFDNIHEIHNIQSIPILFIIDERTRVVKSIEGQLHNLLYYKCQSKYKC